MPEGTGFYINDISMPVSWCPIEQNRKNKLYVELRDPAHVSPSRTIVTKVIEIEEGSYAVVELGNTITSALDNSFATIVFSVTSSYSKKTETIAFSSASGREWRIRTDTERKYIANPFLL